MKKSFLYILCSGALMLLAPACSEDNLTLNESLGETIYDPTEAAPNSIDGQVNLFYERFGSKIIYDFKPSDLYFGWSRPYQRWYVPIPEESDAYISRMITYLSDDVFTDFPDNFVKKFLPIRIFLVDSICDKTTYNKSSLKDVLPLETHGIAIAHVSSDMDRMNEEDWNTIRTGMVTALLNSILSTAGMEPKEFNDLNKFGFLRNPIEDPEGEFSVYEYTCFSGTCVAGLALGDSPEEIMFVLSLSAQEDFGSFVSFIINTSKTKMDRVFARFPIIKRRATIVYNYMLDYTDTDLISYQNATFPADAIPSDYFAN